MGVLIKGKASWYTEKDPGSRDTVAMMSARSCPECWGNKSMGMDFCERCNKKGRLINPMPYNRQGMECAIPESMIEKYGLRFGQLVQVTIQKTGFPVKMQTRSIVVRIVDVGPSEKLFKEENRIIDLTPFAFGLLDDTRLGVIDVEVEIL